MKTDTVALLRPIMTSQLGSVKVCTYCKQAKPLMSNCKRVKYRQTVKPVLVGELNPYGGTDDYALYPAPEGCSGHRLCCLIFGMSRKDYLEAFGRVNLCEGKWSSPKAKSAALALVDAQMDGGRLVLLGSKVCDAFAVKFEPFEVFDLHGIDMLVLPHPSGRCRLWNQHDAFEMARQAVVAFAQELAPLVGKMSRNAP